ncbi:MAG: Rod shape-determining protein MreD [Bacteroidetes bacterium]|nr:MAG: Rod shape-determining protein MreD [Bacteroidota bacterium]
MNRYTIYKIISFFLYLIAQALIFNKIVLFGTAYSFIYIGFLLTLPLEIAIIPGMLVGLALGLGVDAFSNTFGLHAAASVLLMYIRPKILSGLTPQGGYTLGAVPRPKILGLGWFTTYALPIIFVHHLVVFFIEFGGFDLFWSTLLKVLASTAYSFLVIVVIQYMFISNVRK